MRFFDPNPYASELDNKYHIDEISWHTNALATSGKEEYRPTIQAVTNAGHKKLQRHGSDSLKALSNWKKWNPIINSKEYAALEGLFSFRKTALNLHGNDVITPGCDSCQ